MNISDASILITGGANGIGNYLACNLAPACKKVIVIDKEKKVVQTIGKNQNIHCYICDLTIPDEVEKTIAKIYSEHEGINVVVNNAGLIHSEPLLNFLNRNSPKHSIENWKKTIDISLNAVFYVTVNAVEQMYLKRIKNAVIINISSISAQGNAGQSAYSAAKAGIEALTKTWSKELGMFKIRCVAIAPGFIKTESTQNALSENTLAKWEQSVALKRLGNTEEILSGVKFTIENDYFNGKVLSIDGGLNL